MRACVCEREAPKNVLKKSLFSGKGGECGACDVCLREMEGGREREREREIVLSSLPVREWERVTERAGERIRE